MKRIRMDGFVLLDRGQSTFEIEIGTVVVGRVEARPEDPQTGEDDILVVDYRHDIYEDGYSGTVFTSYADAWDFIRRAWKEEVAKHREHEAAQHHERLDQACSSCAYTLRLARIWASEDSDYRDRPMTDDEVVAKYRRTAERMSAS